MLRVGYRISFGPLLILLVSLVSLTGSCTNDEPSREVVQASSQAPIEDESTVLKRAVREGDLSSSPDTTALNCRRLSKSLSGNPMPQELQAKCAEAMLIMVRRSALGQDPVMMRKSPEEWMSEAQSFGASSESVSKVKKQIAADRKKAAADEQRRQDEARKMLRDAGIANRKEIAGRMRTSFLDNGLDIKVRTSGRYAERITFEYALFSDVWSHRFQKEGLVAQLSDAGFERIDMTDGYDWHIYWKF